MEPAMKARSNSQKMKLVAPRQESGPHAGRKHAENNTVKHCLIAQKHQLCRKLSPPKFAGKAAVQDDFFFRFCEGQRSIAALSHTGG